MKRFSVAILGGGLAGLSAAYKLSGSTISATVYEQNSYLGGHASSRSEFGYTFDEGPHISFTKNEHIRKFFSEVVGAEYLESEAIILNYWKGCWLRHPVQSNLFGLPTAIVNNCIDGFRKREQFPDSNDSYKSWCLHRFGQEICDNFIFPYTRKYWTLEASELSTDWVGSRVYIPTLEEVIQGAAAAQQRDQHYITKFRYPKHGGFNAYLNFALKDSEYLLETAVTAISSPSTHSKQWLIESADGKVRAFDCVISSPPLPLTVSLTKNAPQSVLLAASKLKCTSIVLVNIGLRPGTILPDAHWLYIYDEDLVFSRIHFPHKLSPANCPPGYCSLQAEIYYSESRPLKNTDLVELAVKQLVQSGIVPAEEQIVYRQSVLVPFANVIFDHDRSAALGCVNAYLDQIELLRCGRYGNWGYYWTDDTIVSAWEAAEKVLQR